MKFTHSIAAIVGAALVTLSTFAQDNHQAHHPAGASPTAAETPRAPTTEGMDAQLKSMQAMHERMVAAKTPAQRKALMAEHMQTMREGMGMMQKMGQSGGMGGMSGMGAPKGGKAMACDMHESHRMMGMRMEMMESMMQMMMDRMPEPAK